MTLFKRWKKASDAPEEADRLYLLLEPAGDAEMLATLRHHGVNHASLWKLDRMPDLALYAPYLVHLERGGPFDAWLNGKLEKRPVCAFRSGLDFNDAKRHLRRFTKFQGPTGKFYVLRIGSADAVYTYVRSLEDNHDDVSAFFSGGLIDGMLFLNGETLLDMYCEPIFQTEPRPQFRQRGFLNWRDMTLETERNGNPADA